MNAELIFHHFGVACADLDNEIRHFSVLGYRQEGGIFHDPIQQIVCCFLTGPGPRLELIAPDGENSPVTFWLKKGVKYYHQAFEVGSLTAALEEMRNAGGKVVSQPAPAVAFNDRQITFVMMPGPILIELIAASKERFEHDLEPADRNNLRRYDATTTRP